MLFSKKKKKSPIHNPQYSVDYSMWCYWHDLFNSCDFPAGHTLVLRLSLRVRIGRGWLVCKALSPYIESREEGMSYKIQIGHPLLMLKVEKKGCFTWSKLQRSSRVQMSLVASYQWLATTCLNGNDVIVQIKHVQTARGLTTVCSDEWLARCNFVVACRSVAKVTVKVRPHGQKFSCTTWYNMVVQHKTWRGSVDGMGDVCHVTFYVVRPRSWTAKCRSTSKEIRAT